MGEKAEARRESEVWEIVNRERKKVKRINEGLRRNEWEEYFRRLLEEVEERVVRGEMGGRAKEDNERELSGGKIKKAIGKLKDAKTARVDEYLRKYGDMEGKRKEDGWRNL